MVPQFATSSDDAPIEFSPLLPPTLITMRLLKCILCIALLCGLVSCGSEPSEDTTAIEVEDAAAPGATRAHNEQATGPGSLSNTCVDVLQDGTRVDLLKATLRRDGETLIVDYQFGDDFDLESTPPNGISMGSSARLVVTAGSVSAFVYLSVNRANTIDWTVRTHWGGPQIEGATLTIEGKHVILSVPIPRRNADLATVPWSVEALGDTCPNAPKFDDNYLLTDVFAGT